MAYKDSSGRITIDEQAAAQDIFRLLPVPSALDVDLFDRSQVNMLRFQIQSGSPLDGKNMMAVNSMLGGILLVVLNAVGSTVGLMIPLNLVNAVTVGILGVPGVIMLLLFCN